MKEVQAALEVDEVAIDFVSFDLDRSGITDSIMYAAYVVNKRDPAPIFVPLFSANELEAVTDLAGKSATAIAKGLYRGAENENRNIELGVRLYKLIWQPLEPYLKNVKKISYSPANKLYGIAFHALAIDSTSLLMDKYRLQQYTGIRQTALRNSVNTVNIPANIVLFGNPNFSMDSISLSKRQNNNTDEYTAKNIFIPLSRGATTFTWPALTGTEEEVKKIDKLFTTNNIATTLFLDTEASEENFKLLNNNSPDILHVATHGYFLREQTKKNKNFSDGNVYSIAADPLLRSGLILAGGNYAWGGNTPVEGVEDGIVTAYEISQLNLSNTELVVLSACESALGDVKGSEGVFGLQRAFKMAGVKKLIVSLWQVPDKETAELMTAFYTYWMKGKTINEAFTQAQTEMRKKYAPYYWAAFVLVE